MPTEMNSQGDNMEDNRQSVRAVERALQIMQCFTFEKKELSLAELSVISELPKPTVLRLLVTLENQGFVEKESKTQKYRLGMAIFLLGQIVSSSMELRKVALPVMEELSAKTGETININIAQGNERICIEKVDGKHDLRQFVDIGRSLPIYRGASGKLLLAYLPEKQQSEVLSQSKEGLSDTVESLLKQLREIRSRGYAVSHNERVLGAAAVSVPIMNHEAKLLAGLTISGASVRFTEEKVAQYIDYAISAAKKISAALGYQTR